MEIRHLFTLVLLIAVLVPAHAGPTQEFRGAWVTAWTPGFLNQAEADRTVDAAKEANLNALFIQVRKAGDAYYNSNYEPRASNVKDDFDPLAYIIEKAHANGIEVHAWINTFRIWAGSSRPTNPNHIAAKHPGWVTRTASGVKSAEEGLFLDPGVPEVQDYTLNIVMDLIKNYDLDGVHLDYIRYPGVAYGYAQAAVAHFNEEMLRTGVPKNSDPVWQEWRRDQITNLVRRIYRAASKEKPDVKLSAATISWGDCKGNFCDTAPFTNVYQDWSRWLSEGIIDAAIPMNYKDERSPRTAKWYRNWLDGFKEWQSDRHIYGGLDFNKDPNLVVRQLLACRQRGISGMVGFSFNENAARTKLVSVLKKQVFAEAATIPDMPWKSTDVCDADPKTTAIGAGGNVATEEIIP